MVRFVRALVAAMTLVLIGVSGVGMAPWLGQSMPVVSAQFGGFGPGGFPPCSGFNFGACQFGGFSGGLQLGGGQVGGFNFGGGGFNFGGCGGFNLGGGFNFGGGFQFSGQCTGLQFGSGLGVQFGIFEVLSAAASIEPGQQLPIIFAWETPLPQTSNDLRSLELRLREESGAVGLWVRWDEAAGTFSLIDPATEQPLRTAEPRSSGLFETQFFALNLKDSTVGDTGASGPVVALVLPIIATSSAEGHVYRVEERASSDAGEVQGFRTVGTLAVTARAARVEPDPDDPPRSVLTPQQRQRTDRSGRDDVHAEGDVLATECQADTPTVTIANRDGKVTVRLLKDAVGVCKGIRVGDYLEVDGEKVHEALFEAYEASVSRR